MVILHLILQFLLLSPHIRPKQKPFGRVEATLFIFAHLSYTYLPHFVHKTKVVIVLLHMNQLCF